MNRSSLRCAAVTLSVSIAVGCAVKACANPDLVETSGEKSEWSSLQALEYDNRAIPLEAPVIRCIHDREVLGVRGQSGANIWILLRTESPPYYKQIPSGPYDLPVALIDRLEKERRLSYTVQTVLRSHLPETK